MSKLFYFVRQVRTESSERYQVCSYDGQEAVAVIEIHYKGLEEAHLSLILFKEFSKEKIDLLIKEIDDDIVDLADIDKGNFFVRCFQGRELEGFTLDKQWSKPKFL